MITSRAYLANYMMKYGAFDEGKVRWGEQNEVKASVLRMMRKRTGSEYEEIMDGIICEQREDRFNYLRNWITVDNPDPGVWEQFFTHQGMTSHVTNATTLYRWLQGTNGRRNTLKLYGPPGTGKTMLTSALTSYLATGYIGKSNLLPATSFCFESCIDKAAIVFEEPLLKQNTAADMLSIMAGDRCQLSVKYRPPQTYQKTPVIVTTNNSLFGHGFLSPMIETALDARCINWSLTRVWRGGQQVHVDERMQRRYSANLLAYIAKYAEIN